MTIQRDAQPEDSRITPKGGVSSRRERGKDVYGPDYYQSQIAHCFSKSEGGRNNNKREGSICRVRDVLLPRKKSYCVSWRNFSNERGQPGRRVNGGCVSRARPLCNEKNMSGLVESCLPVLYYFIFP